jgi:hypothetical protein
MEFKNDKLLLQVVYRENNAYPTEKIPNFCFLLFFINHLISDSVGPVAPPCRQSHINRENTSDCGLTGSFISF